MRSKIVDNLEKKVAPQIRQKVNTLAENRVYSRQIKDLTMFVDMAEDIISTYQLAYKDSLGDSWKEALSEWKRRN